MRSEACCGRGYGTDALIALSRMLYVRFGVQEFMMQPSARNPRAIRAYEKAGFRSIDIPLAPFFGSMGVAPPRRFGRLNSAPPGIHAGNLDNKEFVAGTTLFIPVHTAGALFEVGDGHAGQGNGEVDITALETELTGTSITQLVDGKKGVHAMIPKRIFH